MITLVIMISIAMVIIATSTMVIITFLVQFKRVFGQGRDGERLLCFVLWSLLCLQVSFFYCYLEKLVKGMS
ncbi:MAG: hypothetical protein VXW83_09195, partial [SAR324 cluster bacterium]|nr:hypothetical protein [SAR324 cluster bacterium]